MASHATIFFGEQRLTFKNPDGETFALAEVAEDTRKAWTENGIPEDYAIRGFHSASIRLQDDGAMAEHLGYMGYQKVDRSGSVTRYAVSEGTGANTIDLQALPNASRAREGAGSVHHIAFAVENRAAQLDVRKALVDTGYAVTPVIDRDYFWAIYFRTPGGVLFEIATNEPGFDRDEDTANLGNALKLPKRHEHLRGQLKKFCSQLKIKEKDRSLNAYHFKETGGPTNGDLIFTFHGTGGSETQFRQLAGDLQGEMHVISIRGDVSERGASRFFRWAAEGATTCKI